MFIWGAWVAQSVQCPTLAQVMISTVCEFDIFDIHVRLCAQSLDPAPDSVAPSLSASPPLVLCLSLSQKQINVKKN